MNINIQAKSLTTKATMAAMASSYMTALYVKPSLGLIFYTVSVCC